MHARTWTLALALPLTVSCGSDNNADDTAYGGGWASDTDSAGGSGSTGWFGGSGLWAEADATVHWTASIDGTATDLLRRGNESLVAGHVDGIATVWAVADGSAEAIWSSANLGADAKLVQGDHGRVRVVALAPDGLAIAPLDGTAESIFVRQRGESPRLLGAVAGANDELWVAFDPAPWESGRLLRLASDGTVVATHFVRDLDQVAGILRDGDRTIIYGNSASGDGWEECVPDDGNPALAMSPGFRITGAWMDGSQAMAGFDVGGAGCAAVLDCEEDDDEMEELFMPRPTQALGPWSYGTNATQLVVASRFDWSFSGYSYELAGRSLVAMNGDADGVAVALLSDSTGASVVQLSAPN